MELDKTAKAMLGMGGVDMALNIIPAILQGIIGGSQLSKAKKIEEQNVRPEATISPSIQKLVNYARGRTFASDIPGGEIYRNQIKGATSAGIKAASELGSGAEAYGMLGRLIGGEQQTYADMAKTTAEQVAGYEKDYMSALPYMAEEENRVWNWNEAAPYLQAAQIAQGLRESGTQNIFAGVSDVFGSASEGVDFASSLIFGEDYGKAKGNVSMDEITKVIKELLG